MSEENKAAEQKAPAQPSGEAPKPDTSPAKKDGSQERFYSQAEVNQIVQERLAREKKEGAGEAPKAKTVPAKKAPRSDETLSERLERMEKDKALSDAILDGGVQLTPGQRKSLRKMLDADSPEDVGSWLEQAISDLGVSAKKEAAAEKQPTPPAPSPPVPPATTPVAKVEDIERAMVHPNKLTREQVQAMGAQKTWEYVQRFIGRTV